MPAAEAKPAAPAPAAELAKPAESVPPRLGLVRAEPDGSVVIAGSAAPGAEVEVYTNGAPLGRAQAESSGDWVLIPDKPLPAGGVEITVAEPDKGKLADQSVVVVIQDDRKTEPLVVASTPGQANAILQGLAKPEVTAAAAQPETAASAAAAKSMEMAKAEPPKPGEAPASVQLVMPPTIDAIEIDNGKNYFAGTGASGSTVRLYVDDNFVADATVDGGHWLVETESNYLTGPTNRVRVDMLRPGTAEVMARAEVNFTISGAPAAPATAVAEAQMPAASADPTAAINAAASDNGSAALASPPIGQTAPAAGNAAAAPRPATASPATAAANPAPAAPAADVPTMTAVPVGSPEEKRYASGQAIIRTGDNLWTIAKRVYGSGYEYITIYRANRGQIRDPDLIYPGQVFDLPTEKTYKIN